MSVSADPDKYLLQDLEGEKKHGLKLREVMERARSQKLFKGHKFYITQNVDMAYDDLKKVIEACGGVVSPAAASWEGG